MSDRINIIQPPPVIIYKLDEEAMEHQRELKQHLLNKDGNSDNTPERALRYNYEHTLPCGKRVRKPSNIPFTHVIITLAKPPGSDEYKWYLSRWSRSEDTAQRGVGDYLSRNYVKEAHVEPINKIQDFGTLT